MSAWSAAPCCVSRAWNALGLLFRIWYVPSGLRMYRSLTKASDTLAALGSARPFSRMLPSASFTVSTLVEVPRRMSSPRFITGVAPELIMAATWPVLSWMTGWNWIVLSGWSLPLYASVVCAPCWA